MSTNLKEEVKLLVESKYKIDFLLENYSKNPLVVKIRLKLEGFAVPAKKPYGDLKAIMPRVFMRSVLPFWETKRGKREWIDDVEPFLVVGGTFNTYQKRRDSEEEETELDKMNRLNKLTKNDPTNSNASHFYKIGDLPLYVAQEGKNRVLMFQKHNKPITARIGQQEFPKPYEMKIHKMLPFNLYALSCANSDFYASDQKPKEPVILPFPELVLPILQNYGVEQGSNIISFSALSEWYKARISATNVLMW